MRFKRGQADQYNFAIVAVLGLGLMALFIYFNRGDFYNIETIIQESITDRHAMALANAMISSEGLVYYDGDTLHRGLLDVEKLDDVLGDEDGSERPLASDWGLGPIPSLPDTDVDPRERVSNLNALGLGYVRSVAILGIETADGRKWTGMWTDLTDAVPSSGIPQSDDPDKNAELLERCVDLYVDETQILENLENDYWYYNDVSECFDSRTVFEWSLMWRMPVSVRNSDGSATPAQLKLTLFEILNTAEKIEATPYPNPVQ